MKSNLLSTIAISLISLLGINSFGQKSNSDFVFTINTMNPGSANNAFSISVDPGNYTYNFDVDWQNDGVFDNTYTNSSVHHINTAVGHAYQAPGIYTIRIRGTYPKLHFVHDKSKLISIDQWGDIQWQSVFDGFRDCDSLITCALDTPDFSAINTLGNMFYGAVSFNGPVNHWDVSSIQYLTYVFGHAYAFNQPLDQWDVSNASQMLGLFTNARSFNQDISNWNTSNLSFAPAILYKASSFDQDLSNWDLSSLGRHDFVQAFDSTAISILNYDNMLGSWVNGNSGATLSVGVSGLTFCDSASRNALINSGWSFIGDSPDSSCITVGLTEKTNFAPKLNIYPNPTRGITSVYVNNSTELKIFNTSGQLMKQVILYSGENIINMEYFETGIYFLKTEDTIFKLVKQ